MVNVIYFNQWFSSIAPVIADIKQKMGKGIKIIASSRNPEHAYKGVVDEFIVEDWEQSEDEIISERNYLNFVLNVCKEYKVDIFFVKKNAELISSMEVSFKKLGVNLVLEDIYTLEKLESKANVYDYLTNKLIPDNSYIIPRYFRFGYKDTGEESTEFSNIMASVDEGRDSWCLKLDIDEGGTSFRKIKPHKILKLQNLNSFRVNEITVIEAVDMVRNLKDEELTKLLFMETLDEPEISIDCYDSHHGFIAICRKKLAGSRAQKIYYEEELKNICLEIKSLFGLKKPFNVQFRVKKGGNPDNIKDLRLLEINPRMSGGTYYSTLYDMNIAEMVIKDILGCSTLEDYNKFVNFEDKKVTFVEQAIKLSE